MNPTKVIKVSLSPYMTVIGKDQVKLYRINRLQHAVTLHFAGDKNQPEAGVDDCLTKEMVEDLLRRPNVDVTVSQAGAD